jgi:hypothetical protein
MNPKITTKMSMKIAGNETSNVGLFKEPHRVDDG